MTPSALEATLRGVFENEPRRPAAAYLFGSQARGTARADSDVDVAILWSGQPEPGLAGLSLDLEGRLEQAVGRPVQLVVLNRAPIDLIHRILLDGRLLLNHDPSARIRFEVRSRNEYWDLEPYLQQYRRAGIPRDV